MQLARRTLLKAALAAGITSLVSCHGQRTRHWLVSACSDKHGQHYGAAFDAQGNLQCRVALPGRGHDALALAGKPGHVLFVSRRPGTYLLEVDMLNGQITRQLEAASDSHFYGHAAQSADGKLIFTTENHFATGQGRIGVRDSDTYQLLASYPSGGIGPHQLALMPDGQHVVIANGGILTHPDKPRKKLNIASMQPNLSYLHLASGKLVATCKPPHHQLSLRHLDVNAAGQVFVGAQFEGTRTHQLPLLYTHEGKGQLVPFTASDDQWRGMRQYTASVQVQQQGDLLTVSAPRGDQITYWHVGERRYLGSDKFKDVAGLSLLGSAAFASNGRGQLWRRGDAQPVTADQGAVFDGLRFDNHMIALRVA